MPPDQDTAVLSGGAKQRSRLLAPAKFAAAAAAVGVALPVAFLTIDRTTHGGWWPPWIAYFWPTDFMTGVASGVVDTFFYEVAAVAILLNAMIYALAGFTLRILLRPFISAS